MKEQDNKVEAVTYTFAPDSILTERQASAAEHCFNNAQEARRGALTVLGLTPEELQNEVIGDPTWACDVLASLQEGVEVYKQMVAIMEAAVSRIDMVGETHAQHKQAM